MNNFKFQNPNVKSNPNVKKQNIWTLTLICHLSFVI
jgi:hypothetical protein